jgi:quinol-cytochrome oxidoreductase complex cytochrome b subunit
MKGKFLFSLGPGNSLSIGIRILKNFPKYKEQKLKYLFGEVLKLPACCQIIMQIFVL